jgi:cation transport ATPase
VGAGVPTRAALACAAVAGFAARALARPAHPADVARIARLVPLLAAGGIAAAAAATHDARASLAVTFAGVAVAAALVVELVIDRARADLALASAQACEGLDVASKVLRGGDVVVVASADVRPGEQVIVEAGQPVGVDGVVVAGEAIVSPFSGAAVELKKAEGDAVIAGARVLSGSLRVNTTWSGLDRAWLKLRSAPALRVDAAAPLARLSRMLTERGAPAAALLCAAAAWVGGGGWVEAGVAACAAAAALTSAGVCAVVGIVYARGQRDALSSGVVYKDAAAFDRAGQVDIAVLCSRGTVLMGEPEIVAIEPFGATDEARLLALAAGAETASTHPFAAAILRAARTRGVRPDQVRGATAHPGLGLTALTSAGERLAVGSRALLLSERVSIALADARVGELEAQGRSVLLVAVADRLAGLIALQDGLRPGARAAVQRLHDARIEPVLLSGEARDTCETMGRALDVEHVRPEVLPSDRGAEVRALGDGGRVVAVLGHPARDDAALGAADVSVAMSAAGAAPGEWTVALASDDVRVGALALALAHQTRGRARAALVAGLAPGVAAVLAVAFGVASPVLGPAAALVGALLAVSRASASRPNSEGP